MASNPQDDNERIALWLVGLVIAVLLLSLSAYVLIKQRHRAAPTTKFAAQAAVELYDAPLTGELLATLHFGLAQASVPLEAAPELARTVEVLMAAPAHKIMIAGFHDASGDAVKNADLAKRRAIATRDLLNAAGVEAARLLLRKPESTLAEGGPDEARRVEIRLLD